jgi:hypothetical protein
MRARPRAEATPPHDSAPAARTARWFGSVHTSRLSGWFRLNAMPVRLPGGVALAGSAGSRSGVMSAGCALRNRDSWSSGRPR